MSDLSLFRFCPYCGGEFVEKKLREQVSKGSLVCGGCGCVWFDITSLRAIVTRVEDLKGATKAIMAAYLDEGFKRVDFRENECFLAATAVRDYAMKEKAAKEGG